MGRRCSRSGAFLLYGRLCCTSLRMVLIPHAVVILEIVCFFFFAQDQSLVAAHLVLLQRHRRQGVLSLTRLSSSLSFMSSFYGYLSVFGSTMQKLLCLPITRLQMRRIGALWRNRQRLGARCNSPRPFVTGEYTCIALHRRL